MLNTVSNIRRAFRREYKCKTYFFNKQLNILDFIFWRPVVELNYYVPNWDLLCVKKCQPYLVGHRVKLPWAGLCPTPRTARDAWRATRWPPWFLWSACRGRPPSRRWSRAPFPPSSSWPADRSCWAGSCGGGSCRFWGRPECWAWLWPCQCSCQHRRRTFLLGGLWQGLFSCPWLWQSRLHMILVPVVVAVLRVAYGLKKRDVEITQVRFS